MRNDLRDDSRADLRRVLADMESLAPLSPEFETQPLQLRRKPRRDRNSLLVALGAAVVVLVLAVPLVLRSPSGDMFGSNNSPPTAAQVVPTTSPSLTEVTNVDASPSSTEATQVGAWTVTEVPYPTVIEAMGQGFVAVSAHEVRSSDDGIEWFEVARLDDRTYLFDLEHRGDTLVGAGSGFVDPAKGFETPQLVWTSIDRGVSWVSVDIGMVADITVTPDGFAAVGIERDNSDPNYNRTGGVLWTSPDGLIWTQIATSDDPEGESSSFRNVVWDGQQLVVLGHRGATYVSEGSGMEDSEHDNVTWYSDGTAISEPMPSSLRGNLDADSTAVTSHGIIATTHWSTPTVKTVGAAWISQDGVTWTTLDVEVGNYEYTDIGHSGDDVFLSGSELGKIGDRGLWVTRDGSSWTRVELPEGLVDGIPQQVEVSEGALVFGADHLSESGQLVGILAGKPRS